LIRVYRNYDLKNVSFVRIGGIARTMLFINTQKELISTLNTLKQNRIKFFIIGNGSNVLFDDSDYDGILIKYINSSVKINKRSVNISAGATISKAYSTLSSHNISLVEKFVSIPASLGGAITNNLGCFNSNISDNLNYVLAVNLQTMKIVKLTKTVCNFRYRKSIFKNHKFVILSANFKKILQDNLVIKNLVLSTIRQKQLLQPLDKLSLGSVFKNTKKYYVAKLIDGLNLKGLSIGGAQISLKHSNFIINKSNAKSKDYSTLINVIKQLVKFKYSVKIKTEIEIFNKKSHFIY